MLLAIWKKNGYEKFASGDSNPDPQNQCELKVNASIHWSRPGKRWQIELKEVQWTSFIADTLGGRFSVRYRESL